MYYTSMNKFAGVKIALLNDQNIIVTLRDNKPNIPFAGMWDLPGGGREGTESAIECAMREIQEELGILLDQKQIIWQREYPALHDESQQAYFMVAKITQAQIDAITFGDEGQGWKLMTIKDFLVDETIVPKLKDRLRDFLTNPAGGDNIDNLHEHIDPWINKL